MEKYGSYCITGLPLLLRIVRPVPIQRNFGVVSTVVIVYVPSGFTLHCLARPGSVCTFFIATWPSPSEYSNEYWSLDGVPDASPACTCVSRVMEAETAGWVAKL